LARPLHIEGQQEQNLKTPNPTKIMKDPIITYRGATIPLSELQDTRVSQLEQQQGTRLIQYRGVSANMPANAPHQKKLRTVHYRGATAEMAV